VCRNPSTHTYCQILFFYLDPLLSNGWKQCEWAIFNGKIGNAHAPCHVTGWYGVIQNHIWNQRPQFAYLLYNFYGAITTIKGSLHGSTPTVKQFSAEKRQKLAPEMAVFRELRGVNVKFLFSNPEKSHPCTEPRRLSYYTWKSVREPRLWAVGRTRKKRSRVNIFDAQFRAYGENKLLKRDHD